MKVKILKFGGSSISNADRIRNVEGIIRQKLNENEPLAVVVSAHGGVTNKLVTLAESAAKGQDVSSLFQDLKEHHIRIIEVLFPKDYKAIRSQIELYFDEEKVADIPVNTLVENSPMYDRKWKKTKLPKKNKIKKKKLENINQPLRIPKNNEQKPEIKKIKKQETEKKQYKVKDYVVYPRHGVGQITEIKKIKIGGIDVETYILKFEKDKANGMVPVNKQSHLRPLATINQINKCVSILKSKPKIKRSMWSRRAQEYEAKISSGKIYELAEVVRDLNKGDDLMVDQSYSE
ncbi:MAG: CarD family transcriptional regulator, partial [Candidatus Marinimicrobia bacterium]|nr:CarD family transcriptional regulator [Candidatus Neomarinimicrobiota bacterium]